MKTHSTGEASVVGNAVEPLARQPTLLYCYLQCLLQECTILLSKCKQSMRTLFTSRSLFKARLNSSLNKLAAHAGLTALDRLVVLRSYNDPDSNMSSQTMPSDPPLGYLNKLTCLQLHVCGHHAAVGTLW
jgi:hypothetical protein